MKRRSKILAKQVSKLAGEAHPFVFVCATLEVVFLFAMSSDPKTAEGRKKQRFSSPNTEVGNLGGGNEKLGY